MQTQATTEVEMEFDLGTRIGTGVTWWVGGLQCAKVDKGGLRCHRQMWRLSHPELGAPAVKGGFLDRFGAAKRCAL